MTQACLCAAMQMPEASGSLHARTLFSNPGLLQLVHQQHWPGPRRARNLQPSAPVQVWPRFGWTAAPPVMTRTRHSPGRLTLRPPPAPWTKVRKEGSRLLPSPGNPHLFGKGSVVRRGQIRVPAPTPPRQGSRESRTQDLSARVSSPVMGDHDSSPALLQRMGQRVRGRDHDAGSLPVPSTEPDTPWELASGSPRRSVASSLVPGEGESTGPPVSCLWAPVT